MTTPGTPLSIDVTAGRKVLHVVTTEKDGVRTEHRYPYEVCGLARCYQTGAYRVICLGEAGLVLFPPDLFERGFVSDEEGSAPATPVQQEQVAGSYQQGSGV